MKMASLATVRDRFTTFVRDVENDGPVTLTRRGEAVAVLISIDEYQRLSKPRQSFSTAYADFLKKCDLTVDGITGDEFPPQRDPSPGRAVVL